ncbi:lipoprotein-anchoring transpeptidase ErfK/SrfK [Rhizobium leucaenae]|uniref:Lipoprotein-anchoring transpeptidase ErfK/SrfK n=2 Tax=Rhizobium leucaenae TaxID=29450 RepID=A0A7W6ZZM2_9HYPH|nr:lipoprotein-anchoring transpeptidase ErfK/SrfK [Rhizobium leucaenae]MBB6304184.1 lipoprotein-anchoring transpeptidase ErfK/SrfK [Rhizobium leucaenae]
MNMKTIRSALLLVLAVLMASVAAHAQEWRYYPDYGDDPDGGYAAPRYWRQAPPDYRDYRRSDDGYNYRNDRYGYYDDEDGDFPARRRPQRRASIDREAIAPQLAPGAKDDRRAGLAKSPIPRTVVPFSGYEPGTIVISTKEKRLYFVLNDGTALKYGIGVGKQGFAWKGTQAISRKAEWPDWTPPKEMIARRPELPDHMDGGLNNPLGARALYLGSTLYRIHGTNEPNSIGKAVSSGCIRMANPDVMDLYGRVGVGTKVVVL